MGNLIHCPELFGNMLIKELFPNAIKIRGKMPFQPCVRVHLVLKSRVQAIVLTKLEERGDYALSILGQIEIGSPNG